MPFIKSKWLDAVTTAQVTETEHLVGLFRFGVEVQGTGAGSITLRVQGTIDGTAWQNLLQIGGPGIYYSSPDTPYPIAGLRLELFEILPAAGPLTVSLIATEVR